MSNNRKGIMKNLVLICLLVAASMQVVAQQATKPREKDQEGPESKFTISGDCETRCSHSYIDGAKFVENILDMLPEDSGKACDWYSLNGTCTLKFLALKPDEYVEWRIVKKTAASSTFTNYLCFERDAWIPCDSYVSDIKTRGATTVKPQTCANAAKVTEFHPCARYLYAYDQGVNPSSPKEGDTRVAVTFGTRSIIATYGEKFMEGRWYKPLESEPVAKCKATRPPGSVPAK